MTCFGCAAQLEHSQGTKPRKWCSESCRVAYWRRKNPRAAADLSARQAERSAAQRRANKPSYTLTCANCGVVFSAGHRNRQYCCSSCRLRAYNAARRADGRSADISARRRALEKGAKVSPGKRMQIAERDGWQCQLCGGSVYRALLYPHPGAAVVDHVVALAKGGEHSPSNWQLSHAFCNRVKSDMSTDELKHRHPDLELELAYRIAQQLE